VKWVELLQALDLVWKVGAIGIGVLVLRRRVDEMGRDALEKSLGILRNQIEDRDKADVNRRERIDTLAGEVRDIRAELDRKEAQILALIDENLTLKRERNRLLQNQASNEHGAL
jgi:hypothetical protein